MSHAAAVWVSGTDVDLEAFERLFRESCEHEGLGVEVFVRSEPAAVVAVAALDEHDELQMDFDLLNQTAAALARALQRRVYALYAFFGSGDWMMVTAMSEAGELAWSEGSSEDGEARQVGALSDELGVEVNGLTLPYWRLIAEAAPACRDDLLGVGIKPTFDLGFIDGWSSKRSFKTPRKVKVKAQATGNVELSATDLERTLMMLRAASSPSMPPPEEEPRRRGPEDLIALGMAKIAELEGRSAGPAKASKGSKKAPKR